MIIYFEKTTGKIIGTTEGRIHDYQLNTWIGDKEKTDRIIIQWKAVKCFNKEGQEVSSNSPLVYDILFEPNHPQKELFMELDKNTSKVYEYKVDLKTKQLVKK